MRLNHRSYLFLPLLLIQPSAALLNSLKGFSKSCAIKQSASKDDAGEILAPKELHAQIISGSEDASHSQEAHKRDLGAVIHQKVNAVLEDLIQKNLKNKEHLSGETSEVSKESESVCKMMNKIFEAQVFFNLSDYCESMKDSEDYVFHGESLPTEFFDTIEKLGGYHHYDSSTTPAERNSAIKNFNYQFRQAFLGRFPALGVEGVTTEKGSPVQIDLAAHIQHIEYLLRVFKSLKPRDQFDLVMISQGSPDSMVEFKRREELGKAPRAIWSRSWSQKLMDAKDEVLDSVITG
ncbi:hypothetical protein PGT21_034797 [Puccinia graminis f. sp. tritici]|uniref:Uncharacterized protein n=1 Tax=Puccinia graminis f. sp. tritici TaxID=56615 RepID=A0A5B0MYI6_PUCGR|nr:hypothetical protein PGT21_034797 [Puccinia graminis f. sp. tritici]KAA1091990.1 hypothetical protein PGTUg99_009231 [Puccinia graminis f. sp. tritici]